MRIWPTVAKLQQFQQNGTMCQKKKFLIRLHSSSSVYTRLVARLRSPSLVYIRL